MGSGQAGAIVFTLDKQNLTNAEQARVDSIFLRYAERCNRRFEGLEDFLYVAPSRTEKLVFTKKIVGYKTKFFFSGFRNIEEDDLGTNVISTHTGNRMGDDLYDVREFMTETLMDVDD